MNKILVNLCLGCIETQILVEYKNKVFESDNQSILQALSRNDCNQIPFDSIRGLKLNKKKKFMKIMNIAF